MAFLRSDNTQSANSTSNTQAKIHNVIMENRKSLSISGVKDIDSFDDNQIVLYTEMGELIIKGKNLHIQSFNNESGDFSMTGAVQALIYSESRSNVNFITKLFR